MKLNILFKRIYYIVSVLIIIGTILLLCDYVGVGLMLIIIPLSYMCIIIRCPKCGVKFDIRKNINKNKYCSRCSYDLDTNINKKQCIDILLGKKDVLK